MSNNLGLSIGVAPTVRFGCPDFLTTSTTDEDLISETHNVSCTIGGEASRILHFRLIN
jgi:hypothetical protein